MMDRKSTDGKTETGVPEFYQKLFRTTSKRIALILVHDHNGAKIAGYLLFLIRISVPSREHLPIWGASRYVAVSACVALCLSVCEEEQVFE